MVGWFSTALIGTFRSSLFHSVICSLGGPLSHGSPVVVFFDRWHPHFWNFYSTIPVDVVRVKSREVSNFGWQTKCTMGNVEMANWKICLSKSSPNILAT